MIALQRPSDEQIREMLRSLADAPFNYDAVGCLRRKTIPSGFNCDQASFPLGYGDAAWQAARKAIESWAMFPEDMVSMIRLSDAIEEGVVVAVLCRALALWTINPARVFHVVDHNNGTFHVFGFTYGTLPGHVEAGEESFVVVKELETGRVFYHIKAASRPSHPLVWLGYPFTRHMQAKFRALSGASMQSFVENCTSENVSSKATDEPKFDHHDQALNVDDASAMALKRV